MATPGSAPSYGAVQATMSAQTRQLLRRAGCSVGEVVAMAPSALAKLLNVSPQDALRVQQEISARPALPQVTALDLLEQNAKRNLHVSTQCRDLDSLLGGGVARGQVTELCGGPGSGKTQVCMQACVSAWLPEDIGGLGAQSVYLDTEGSFSPHRARQMADAMAAYVNRLRPDAPSVTGEHVLDSIAVARAHDAESQLAFVRHLKEYLTEHPGVALVVVDSIAFHFRYDFADMSKRTRTLTRMAQQLNAVAAGCNVAVLVTNHMTTRLHDELVPALGESWSHAITTRLLLVPSDAWVDGDADGQVRVRSAELVKSPSQVLGACSFVVLDKGVRKVPASSALAVGAAADAKRART